MMPILNIQLKSGRTPEQKEKLAEAIFELMEEQGFAKRENVKILYSDIEPEDFHEGSTPQK